MIVLDTHALLWWVNGQTGDLGPRARRLIQSELEAGDIVISSITTWEIAMLVAKGRLALSADLDAWLARVGAIEAVRFVPVDNAIAVASVNLPGPFHADPADRIIVATARRFDAPLVTGDGKVRGYPHVRSVW